MHPYISSFPCGKIDHHRICFSLGKIQIVQRSCTLNQLDRIVMGLGETMQCACNKKQTYKFFHNSWSEFKVNQKRLTFLKNQLMRIFSLCVMLAIVISSCDHIHVKSE